MQRDSCNFFSRWNLSNYGWAWLSLLPLILFFSSLICLRWNISAIVLSRMLKIMLPPWLLFVSWILWILWFQIDRIRYTRIVDTASCNFYSLICYIPSLTLFNNGIFTWICNCYERFFLLPAFFFRNFISFYAMEIIDSSYSFVTEQRELISSYHYIMQRKIFIFLLFSLQFSWVHRRAIQCEEIPIT